MNTPPATPDTPVLTAAEKQTLLRIARETLTAYLKRGLPPEYHVKEPGLLQHSGAFVTLHRRNGELRGCIGRLDAADALYRTVQECVISAATRDYRFAPMTSPLELDDVVIEISALSPFRRIESIDEIEVGKHGLLIRQGGASGLLLPQVATERGWDRAQFLRALCTKAGLPARAWERSELSVFSAEVFGEGEDLG